MLVEGFVLYMLPIFQAVEDLKDDIQRTPRYQISSTPSLYGTLFGLPRPLFFHKTCCISRPTCLFSSCRVLLPYEREKGLELRVSRTTCFRLVSRRDRRILNFVK